MMMAPMRTKVSKSRLIYTEVEVTFVAENQFSWNGSILNGWNSTLLHVLLHRWEVDLWHGAHVWENLFS